jgi:hypothetical protein
LFQVTIVLGRNKNLKISLLQETCWKGWWFGSLDFLFRGYSLQGGSLIINIFKFKYNLTICVQVSAGDS